MTEKIPNVRKVCPHFPFQGSPKYTQNGIFGMKIDHLATLDRETRQTFFNERKTRQRVQLKSCNKGFAASQSARR
jgi:hypothetical protein